MSTEATEVGAEESLASILANEPSEPTEIVRSTAEPVAASEPVKAEPTAGPARGADGKFAAKTDEPAAAAAPAPTEAQAQPAKQGRPEWVGALVAMRKEAQAAKREAAAATPNSPPPDFYADPTKAVAEAVSAETAKLRGQMFSWSLRTAKAVHTDYDEAGQAFAEAAQRDPRLVELMQNDDDPGELVYAIGTQIRELSDVGGDIVAYRAKVTAEASAKLTEAGAQLKARDEKIAALERQLSELSTVGRSLNTTASARPVAAHEVDEDDVRSIVRFGNKPK